MIWKLLLSFLKIGTLGFGSGAAMLALIEREMRDLGVMDAEQFTDAVAFGTCLPGPIAPKMALYCGYTAAGLPGALVAFVAILLPSTVAILLLARAALAFRGNARLEGGLKAVKPVVVALFLHLALFSSRGISPSWDMILLGALALALLILRVDPAWVVLGALTLGVVAYA